MNNWILEPTRIDSVINSNDDAAELQEEYLAICRILQAQSAVHLLRQAGNNTHRDELERTLATIDEWIGGVENDLSRKVRTNSLAAQVLQLMNGVRFSQQKLRAGLSSSHSHEIYGSVALRAIRATYGHVRHAFSSTFFESAFLSNGCACEIDLLVETRRS